MKQSFLGPGFSCSECDSMFISLYSLWKEDVRVEDYDAYSIIIKLKPYAQFIQNDIYF